MKVANILSLCHKNGISITLKGANLKISAKSAVSDEIKALLKENKAQIIAFLSAAQEDDNNTITPIAQGKNKQLSSAQERMWLVSELIGPSAVYNISLALQFDATLNVSALEQAFSLLVSRQEALRTHFEMDQGMAVQVVSEPSPVTLPITKVSHHDELVALWQEERHFSFDLENGPLYRARLVEQADGNYALMLVMHHIISDGWSLEVFFKELLIGYRHFHAGHALTLPELSVQYSDYAHWQRQWMSGERLQQQLRYWHNQLADLPPLLNLPTDFERPAQQSFKGGTVNFSLSQAVTEQLQALSLRHDATLFMTLVASFSLLLSRYSGQSSLAIGTPVANRNRPEVEGLIGFFVNTLVLRCDIDETQTFEAMLKEVRETVLQAYSHQYIPFEQLVEVLKPERNLSHGPLFQVMLGLQQTATVSPNSRAQANANANADESTKVSEGVDANQNVGSVSALDLDEGEGEGVARFDLTFNLNETPDGLFGTLEFNQDIFKVERIERLLAHFEVLLGAIAQDASQPVAHYDFTLEAEKATLLQQVDSAETSADVAFTSFAQRFATQYQNQGDAIALRDEKGEWDYSTLAKHASDVSHAIQQALTPSAAPVLLIADPSKAWAMGLLGILQSGASYLVVSPNTPTLRLRWIMEQTQAQCVLCSEAVATQFASVFATSDIHIIHLNDSNTASLEEPADVLAVDASRVAGWQLRQPNAHHGGLVPITHGVLSAGLDAIAQSLPAEHPHSLHYLGLTPATANVLRALCAGECVDLCDDTLQQNNQAQPASRVVGSLLPGQRGYVLQAHMQTNASELAWRLAPQGTVGQLFVTGESVAMAEEQCIDVPLKLMPTGHLVRQLSDDQFEWLSGADATTVAAQAKVITSALLHEEEAVLRQLDDVKDAAIVNQGGELIAFVESDMAAQSQDNIWATHPLVAQLYQQLQHTLPGALLPSQVEVMATLPRTAHGQIDHQALLDTLAPEAEWEYVAPEGPTETLLAAQWQLLLQQDFVSRDDNFFELGGYSLLASQLVSRIREVFSVEVPLRTLFEHQTLRSQAQAIEHAVQGDAGTTLPSIVAQDYSGPQPLSFAQQRLWFLSRMMPPNAVYNVPVAMHLKGDLNMIALRRAIDAIWQRHPSLRTRFGEVNGEGKQWVEPFTQSTLQAEKVADETALKAACLAEHRYCFDLAEDSLVRVRLFEVDHVGLQGMQQAGVKGNQQGVYADTQAPSKAFALCITLHHIICDGWSMGVLFHELMQAYQANVQGETLELPELQIDYCDYSIWQREQLTDDVLAEQVNYWREQLAGSPPVLDLPTDFPRPAEQSFKGDSLPIRLDPELTPALHALSRSAGMTPFMILISTFAMMLGRYSQQDDVMIGTPVANRHRPETEGLIGFFLNSLALRFDLSGNPSFIELLRRTRETTLQAYANQDVPFEQLVEALRPERSLSHSPLFQVSFSLLNTPAQDSDTAGLEVSGLALDEGTGVSRYDLTFNVSDTEQGIIGALEYNTDIFSADTLKQWIVHYERLLKTVIEQPNASIDDVSFLSEDDVKAQLGGWNDNATAYPSDECVHRIFERCAEENVDVIAIEHQGETMTYGELNSRANRLAHFLKTRDVGADVCVGVCMDRSLDLVVSLLGILKAGGAYVPMDPSYPESRLLDMMEQSQCELVLTESHWLSELEWLSEVANLPMDRDWQDRLLSRFPEENLERDPCESPLNLAYIIYTSGSTGRPKGVMINHDNITSLSCASSTVEVTKDDVVAQAANYAFDAVTYEIWAALLNGAKAVLIDKSTLLQPAQLADQLHASGVSILFITTALFNRITQEAPHCFSKLNKLLFGGEAYSPDAIENAVMQDERANHLLHVYGPTECTTFATGFELTKAQFLADRQAPIGVPLSNNTAYVMHGYSLAPKGAVGELCIGGEGLARGYLNRGGFTADKFMPNPFSDKPGARLYRTGDLVRLRADGVIDFVGRVDHQVKIRGFRIELGEIEELLLSHESVEEVLVLAREDKPGEKRLVAYLVLDKSQAENDGLQSQWAEFLRGNIPDYAIPSAFVVLESMPLNHNGKIDRNRLPQPSETAYALADYIAPQTEVEKQLAHIWETNLGLDRVGIEDNYFAVGGDSIRSISLVSDAKKIGLHFAIKDLFANPTISALSKVLEVGEAESEETQTEKQNIAPFSLINEAEKAKLPTAVNGSDVEDAYPLSMLQQGMIFHSMQDPDLNVYNNILSFIVDLNWNENTFRAALNEVIAQHPILRTSFFLDLERPIQLVLETYQFAISTNDLTHLEAQAQLDQIQQFQREEQGKDIDLVSPWRLVVNLLGDNKFELSIIIHHALMDGWSDASFVQQALDCYQQLLEGNTSLDLDTPPAYNQFIALELAAIDSTDNQRYWREELEEARCPWWTGVEKSTSVRFACDVTQDDSERFIELASELQVQEKSIWCAVYLSLIYVLEGNDDFLGSAVVHGRPELSGAEKMYGLFLNSLPMRYSMTGKRWKDFILAVDEKLKTLHNVRHYPVAKIQEETGLDFAASLFNFTNFHVYDEGDDSSFNVNSQGDSDETNYLFLVNVQKIENKKRHVFLVNAEPNAFDAKARENIQHFVANIIRAIKTDVEQPVDRQALLGEAALNQLFNLNQTSETFPEKLCIHELFERSAQNMPQETALIFNGDASSDAANESSIWTYETLNQKANQLAHYLRENGVETESRVAVFVDNSPLLVMSILACLKAGACYVPIDANMPEGRAQYILKDADVKWVLTHSNIMKTCQGHFAETDAAQVPVDAIESQLAGYSAENIDKKSLNMCACNLAHTLYTSGSTGLPKGVMGSHQMVVNRLTWLDKRLPVNDDDVFCLKTSIVFVDHVAEIFQPLINARPLAIMPQSKLKSSIELIQALNQHRITRLTLVPSLLKNMISTGETLPHMKWIMCSGEELLSSTLTGFETAFPSAGLYNIYGSTEMAADVTFHEMEREQIAHAMAQTSMPIGQLIQNAQAFILDDHFKLVPYGTPGKLFIGGVCLARGYHHHPSMTAEKFIPNPFTQDIGQRLFNTGDLARYNAQGEIEYLGRVDHQVKIRGHRIELAEIENSLLQCPEVFAAVVTVVDRTGADGNESENKALVAYWVPAQQPDAGADSASNLVLEEDDILASETAIRAQLQRVLPSYMMPASLVALAAMPRNTSGKVDRAKLPAPTWGNRSDSYEAPANPTEQLLANIWLQVLNVEQVDRRNSFFELGGHSLLATQLLLRIKQTFSVSLPMRLLFENQSLMSMAQMIMNLSAQAGDAQGLDDTPLTVVSREHPLPLSFAQQRLWFLDQLVGANSAYNIPMVLRLRGEINEAALTQSLNAIIARHESFRTRFAKVDNAPVQMIHPFVAQTFEFEAVSDMAQVEARVKQAFTHSFELDSGELYRFDLLQLVDGESGEKQTVIIINLHHIIADGWSTGLFFSELIAHYRAFSHNNTLNVTGSGDEAEVVPNVPALAYQYADFAQWQRARLQGEVLQEKVDFWAAQLQDAPALLALPTDRPRPAEQSFNGATETVQFDRDLMEKLKAISLENNATLFMTLLSAYSVLLSRYSGQKDVVIGSPVANRDRTEIENVIGCFINNLALRTRLENNPQFDALLQQTRDNTLQCYGHQDLPFEYLVDALNTERSLSYSPVFQVMFVLQNAPKAQGDMQGLQIEAMDFNSAQVTSRYDMTLALTESENGLYGKVEYNTDLFDRSTIKAMFSHFERLLRAICDNPRAQVESYSLLSEEEVHQQLVEWNQTQVDFGPLTTLHQAFEHHAEATPNAVALMHEQSVLSYGELNQKANLLARHLVKQGVQIEDKVAVCLDRSPALIISLLAILKAGACYVPLDPAYPESRIKYLLQDSQAQKVISVAQYGDLVADACDVIAFDATWEQTGLSSENLNLAVPVQNLAYIIYTSGSTGFPKGVSIEHRNIMSLLQWADDLLPEAAKQGVLASTSVCFDLSAYEMYLPLCTGNTCILIDNILSLESSENKAAVTLLNTVPSAAKALLERDAIPPHLVCLNLAGEPLKASLVDALYAQTSVSTVYDLYGPSETTTYSSYALRKPQGIETIGGPVANTEFYVLDENGALLPPGAMGELYIGGAGVSRGYLNNSAQTSERFIPNGFKNDLNERLYKTGDLVRFLHSGELQYIGRLDHQIKLRGYRIELGEIEKVLLNNEKISDAVVIVDGVDENKQIVAYLVSEKSNEDENISAEIKASLAAKLPDFMVPSHLIYLEKLPLTPNGKLDRAALPKPEQAQGKEYQAPEGEFETGLAEIWSELLQIDLVGRFDNFFESGGNSLLVIKMASMVRENFDVELDIKVFYKFTTLCDLANQIQKIVGIENISEDDLDGLTEEEAEALLRDLGEV